MCAREWSSVYFCSQYILAEPGINKYTTRFYTSTCLTCRNPAEALPTLSFCPPSRLRFMTPLHQCAASVAERRARLSTCRLKAVSKRLYASINLLSKRARLACLRLNPWLVEIRIAISLLSHLDAMARISRKDQSSCLCFDTLTSFWHMQCRDSTGLPKMSRCAMSS